MKREITRSAVLVTIGAGIGIVVCFGVLTFLNNLAGNSDFEQQSESQRPRSDVLYENAQPVGQFDNSKSVFPQDLNDLELSESAYERRLKLSSWILKLNESQLIDWLERSSSSDWDVSQQVRKDFQSILLHTLTPYNPTAALDFTLARKDPVRFELLRRVFYEWAIVDLDSSVKHASDLPQELSAFALYGIFEAQDSLSLDEHKAIALKIGNESYATTFHLQKFLDAPIDNPRETWHDAVVLAEPIHEHYQILAQIAVTWIEASGVEVLDEIISSVDDENMRASISLEVLRELALSVPDQAFAFALDLESKNREFVARSVIQTWAKLDPHVALEAIKAIPPSQFRSDLEFSAVQQWVQRDPRDVLGRLREIPISVREDAISESVYWIAQDAPAEAASLVQQLDKESQWNARAILMESWLTQDFEAAIDWAENSDSIDSEVRPYLLHDVAVKVLWIDPTRAFQIARKVSLLAENEIGSEAMIIGRIAHSDLNLAQELLPQVRSGDTKTQAYVAVASELIVQGDTQAALNLGSQLPESDLDTFLIDLAQRWAFQDMTGLLAEMDSFPTAEIRSKIALTLTANAHSRDRFTDTQIEQLQNFLSSEDKATLENNPQ